MLLHPDLILRHRKENLKKCSLRGLEGDSRFCFLTYPHDSDRLPPLEDYLLLEVGAPPLTQADAGSPLLLIDSTWRYAPRIRASLSSSMRARSLPGGWETAYPRRQDVPQGLASIEALFATYWILGRETEGLLTHYLWRAAFLQKNQEVLAKLRFIR